jgi:cholestenol Delta-isomerase
MHWQFFVRVLHWAAVRRRRLPGTFLRRYAAVLLVDPGRFASMVPHPYHPLDLDLPEFHDQVIGMEFILGVFFGVAAIVIGLCWTLARSLPGRDRAMVVWLVFSGTVHLVVEGAFSLNPKFFQNSDSNMLLLELWKEYSKADSRYASRDAFTTTMETTTAFAVGPGCLLAAYGLLRSSAWRWCLIIVLSTFQLYGDILYFATYWFDGGDFTRPEPLYFWLYFVVMNGIWVVVPLWCVWVAVRQSVHATLLMEKTKTKRR